LAALERTVALTAVEYHIPHRASIAIHKPPLFLEALIKQEQGFKSQPAPAWSSAVKPLTAAEGMAKHGACLASGPCQKMDEMTWQIAVMRI